MFHCSSSKRFAEDPTPAHIIARSIEGDSCATGASALDFRFFFSGVFMFSGEECSTDPQLRDFEWRWLSDPAAANGALQVCAWALQVFDVVNGPKHGNWSRLFISVSDCDDVT